MQARTPRAGPRINCWDTGGYTNAEFRNGPHGGLEVGDHFRVSFLFNDFPVPASEEMIMQIDRNGCGYLRPHDYWVPWP